LGETSGSNRMRPKLGKTRKKNKYPAKKVSATVKHDDFYISENNRLTYSYKLDVKNKIAEVTCVSLDIKIQDEWMTIVYYDSYHEGQLHRHPRISYFDPSDAPTMFGVKRKGSQNKLLRWAIKDIENNWLVYKQGFIKRSNISNNNTDIPEIELY